MAETRFDLILIGGGPGGYVAAIRAAQLGMNVALVEREHLGGICLNWGCIPTKALLRSAEILTFINHAKEFGLEVKGDVAAILPKIVERSRKVSGQLSAGVKGLLKKNKVTVFDASGALAGKLGEARRVALTGKNGAAMGELTAPHVILATGARARSLPGLEPDGKFIWTYKEALVPDRLPKSLAVIGSGAIGIEFASFFNALGVEVTVLEMLDRILPVEDEEISAFARKSFEKQGMKILTSVVTKSVTQNADQITVRIEQGGKTQDITGERILVAAGIVGNVENIGLEGTGARVEKTHVVVDRLCRTGEPGVYAIGDLAGPPWLAHKASHEGVICVEAIAGHSVHPLDASMIPGCTYSTPQIASVGFTEAKAKAAGYSVRVGRFPFIGNGKAIAMGEPEGMVKTVFDAKTGELLGAHMIGAEVTEMIQGYTIARTLEATEAELMHTVFPHPTLSEMMHESVLNAYNRTIHF